jgi:hypothetical protein
VSEPTELDKIQHNVMREQFWQMRSRLRAAYDEVESLRKQASKSEHTRICSARGENIGCVCGRYDVEQMLTDLFPEGEMTGG